MEIIFAELQMLREETLTLAAFVRSYADKFVYTSF